MRQLENLIQRIRKTLDKEEFLKETISQIIEEKTKITIPKEKISFNEPNIIIESRPTEKTQILFKEAEILREIKEKGRNYKRIIFK